MLPHAARGRYSDRMFRALPAFLIAVALVYVPANADGPGSRWDVPLELGKHRSWVMGCAFDRTGTKLYSSGLEGKVIAWNVSAGKQVVSLDIDRPIALSPSGDILACQNESGARIDLLDLATGHRIAALDGHTDVVTSLAFSRDGRFLVSGSTDKSVRIWDVEIRKQVFALSGHEDAVTCVAISADGRTVASGGLDTVVRLWDASTGATLGTLASHTDAVQALEFAPGGKILASGSKDSAVVLWSVATHKEIGSFDHKTMVHSLAFTPDGTSLAVGLFDGTIHVWSAAGAVETAVISAHTGAVAALAFSPDGTTLASGGADGAVRLWKNR
jgi:WD40 repeat protein